MPKRKVPVSDRFPYQVVARSNNKDFFHAPLPLCWAIFCNCLSKTIEKYQIEVLAFVMMSNHIHLLLKTPSSNLGAAMNYFMRESSRGVGRASGRINHLWGGRHKPSLIESSDHFANVYKYVYRNPVEAGLSLDVESYRYSSLRWVLRDSAPFPLRDDVAKAYGDLSPSLEQRLAWMNLPYSAKQKELIRRGLRRGTFQYSTDNNFRDAVLELS